MKTRCSKCRTLISYGERFCDKCKTATNKENKESLKNKVVESTTKSSRWKALRRQILLRDKMCLLCWNRDRFINMKGLQVHHIVKRVDDETLIYEPNNLVTLCRNCHEEMEKLPIVLQRKALGDYEKSIEYTLL